MTRHAHRTGVPGDHRHRAVRKVNTRREGWVELYIPPAHKDSTKGPMFIRQTGFLYA